MLVGLAAAALQGAPVVTQDVDLWFKDLDDPRLRAALRKAGARYIPSMGMNPPVFAGEGAELFDIVTHMHGIGEFDEEKPHSSLVSLGSFKVRVLDLDRILQSKRALDRPKDQLYLKVLEDAGKALLRHGAATRKRRTES